MINLNTYNDYSVSFHPSDTSVEIAKGVYNLFPAEKRANHMNEENNSMQYEILLGQQSSFLTLRDELFQDNKTSEVIKKMNFGQKEKRLVWMGSSLLEKGTPEYTNRRKSNNEAVKRWRKKMIQTQNEKEKRMKELEYENENLKNLIFTLKQRLKILLYIANKKENQSPHTNSFMIDPIIFDSNLDTKMCEDQTNRKESIQSNNNLFSNQVNHLVNLSANKNNDSLPFDLDQINIQDLLNPE